MTPSVSEIADSLSIAIASSDQLRTSDCRRLTGPGLLWGYCGAVLDIFIEGFEPELIVELWLTAARRVLDSVGWQTEKSMARRFNGGVNLAISAPMDQLYSATFVAQTAWHFCAAKLLDAASGDFDIMIADLKQVMKQEANPALIALIKAAKAKGIDVLCDDDLVSIGHGSGSQTWPVASLPSPDMVDWRKIHNVPLALITGTNGKTTTTRLCAAIGTAAGQVSGLTSTDFVRVGDDILERGDFSGPGGARMLLRDARLEMGFLEVARGGILRRGLPVRQARAAAVLNAAADHLGDYGVNTVADLAATKLAVQRALVPGGTLVLNADDAYVVAEAVHHSGRFCWFSLDINAPMIVAARAAKRPCAWLEGTDIIYFDGAIGARIIDIASIPIAMGGAAKYNISNALAAICVSFALGIEADAIRTGLSGFQNNTIDNPGRCNEFAHKGARVFVDFAHNPHSIVAVTGALAAIPAKRKFIMISHAGDRSDQDIRDLTTGAFALKPDFVVAAELPDYLRGRPSGEVVRIIKETSKEIGLPDDHIFNANSPSDGVDKILRLLEPGDLALLLVHSQRDQIFDMLTK